MGSFLKYAKTVIQKMSFDRRLLNKEYRKCLIHLSAEEQRALSKWLKDQPYYSLIDSIELQKKII